jgi:hypothetical protein
MDAAVVDDVGLDDLVAAGLENLREAVAEKYVAQVAEVEGFVGVGRRVFDHDELAVSGDGTASEVLVGDDALKDGVPVGRLDDDVEEALDDIESLDGRLVGDKPRADFVAHGFGSLAGGLDPGEDDNGDVALEFLACGLRTYRFGSYIDIIKFFDSLCHG